MRDVGRRAIEHCRALLRIDTSNPGSTEERAAAYVLDALVAAGLSAEVLEPEPGRCSVVCRMPGGDPALPALLVHGHLDVVPAQDHGWTHDPFGGVEANGCLWGRGAVDMKNAVAMMLAAQQELAAGAGPRRTLVFAYFADEEMGGTLGAAWLAGRRPDLVAGVAEALGEFGGFSVALPDGRRLYPIQCVEKGLLWLRLTIGGTGGHAAFSPGSNALVRAATIVKQIAEMPALPGSAPHAHQELTRRIAEIFGPPRDGGAFSEEALTALGTFGAMAQLGDRTRCTPTIAGAGTKENVIPDRAEITVDARVLPGRGDATLTALVDLLADGDEHEVLKRTPGIHGLPEGPLYERCAAALRSCDGRAIVAPFVNSAGTDAQHFASLGIRSYGFSPLPATGAFDYLDMFHAVDERVPVDALGRGARVLLDVLSGY